MNPLFNYLKTTREVKPVRNIIPQNTLLGLPTDLIHLIIGYLSRDPTLLTLRATCRKFRVLIPPDSRLLACASLSLASYGYLNILKWGHSLQYKLSPMTKYSSSFRGDEMLCNVAAAKGHLEILKWAHAQGCSLSTDVRSQALNLGNLEMLQWVESKLGDDKSSYLCREAAALGHLHILQWAFANGYPLNETERNQGGYRDTIHAAAEKGHVHIVEWLLAQGVLATERTCYQAALYGKVEVLKFLKTQEYPHYEASALAAAGEGKIEVLQWMFETGGESLMDSVTSIASRNRNLSVLEWAHQKRLRFYPRLVSVNYSAEVNQWLDDHEYP